MKTVKQKNGHQQATGVKYPIAKQILGMVMGLCILGHTSGKAQTTCSEVSFSTVGNFGIDAKKMILTQDDNLVLVGQLTAVNAPNQTDYGTISKINPVNNTILWSKRLSESAVGVPNPVRSIGVAQLANGSIITGNLINEDGSTTVYSFSNNGSLNWSRKITVNDVNGANRFGTILAMPNGNPLLVHQGASFIHLVQLNRLNGQTVSVHRISNAGMQSVKGVFVSNGNLFLMGFNGRIMLLSPQFGFIFNRIINLQPTYNFVEFNDVIQLANGNFILTGTAYSNFSDRDIVLVETDINGNPLRVRTINDPGVQTLSGEGHGLLKFANSFAIVGKTQISSNPNKVMGYMANFDNTLNLNAHKRISSTGNLTLKSVITRQGTIHFYGDNTDQYIIGSMTGAGVSCCEEPALEVVVKVNTFTQTPINSTIVQTVASNIVFGTNTNDGDINVYCTQLPARMGLLNDKANVNTPLTRLEIYPNPANTKISLKLENQNAVGSVSFYDATGKLVATSDLQSLQNSIDTANWPNGIYLVKIESAGEIQHKKVVIEH